MKLGKNINNAFSKVYVKNLLESKKRLESFTHHADIINLKYKVYSAFRGDLYVPKSYTIKHRSKLYPTPYNQYLAGNHYTWLSIHLDAMINRYESYVICDDDTIFKDLEIPDIHKAIPIDWDILILGDMSNVNSNTNELIFNRLNYNIAGCHCIAINSKCYFKVLNHLTMFDTLGYTGDVSVNHLSTTELLNVYEMFPSITYQDRKNLIPYSIE